jgi:hypothetical protein
VSQPFVQSIAMSIDGTLNLTVLRNTPAFVLIVTLRVTVAVVGFPKTKPLTVPRPSTVVLKFTPGVA